MLILPRCVVVGRGSARGRGGAGGGSFWRRECPVAAILRLATAGLAREGLPEPAGPTPATITDFLRSIPRLQRSRATTSPTPRRCWPETSSPPPGIARGGFRPGHLPATGTLSRPGAGGVVHTPDHPATPRPSRHWREEGRGDARPPCGSGAGAGPGILEAESQRHGLPLPNRDRMGAAAEWAFEKAGGR